MSVRAPYPAHLINFIKGLKELVENGRITAAQAQPMLDGAEAVLEQIEGNNPNRTHTDDSDREI